MAALEPSSTAEWIQANPPPDDAFVQSAAGVARRALAGEDFRAAARELQDELQLLQTNAQRTRAIAEEPPRTGRAEHDAYLAGLAEHFSGQAGISRPGWTTNPERFLDRFFFWSAIAGFRATAIAQSPAAFRRRGVFVTKKALERV